MPIIDISLPLSTGMPAWPGSPGFEMTWANRIDAEHVSNNSVLHTDSHIGTHVDAPLHFVPRGTSVETLSLDVLVGEAVVACVPGVKWITAEHLDALDLPTGTERLLLQTDNSALWDVPGHTFDTDFAALAKDAARWVVERGIRLVGVDYLSVQRYDDGPAVHQILLEAGVVIVEGLYLTNVVPGTYELVCLPLKVVGAEGAPARAILRTREAKQS